MISKVIVIGASGFIGKAVYNNLILKNIDCVGLSSKEADLLTEEGVLNLKSTINNNDKIIFISALAPCIDKEMLKKNLLIMNNFIKAIINIDLKNILYVSSDAVYEDSLGLISEDNNRIVSNYHGNMHIKREEIITEYCDNRNINLTIIRPTLVYGPGDTHNGYGPNKFIRDLNSGNLINLFGKGEEKRDHIFIDDVVNVINECIIENITGNITLATGRVVSFFDIAKMTCKSKNVSVDRIKFNKRIGGMPHNGYRAFDVSKLKNKLSSLKFTGIEEGIKISIDKLF